MTYMIEYHDERGDTVDQDIACSRLCANDHLRSIDVNPLTPFEDGVEAYEYFGYESDSDVFCVSCGVLVTVGIATDEPRTTDDGERCHRCPPVVVQLARTDTFEHCDECGGTVQVPRP